MKQKFNCPKKKKAYYINYLTSDFQNAAAVIVGTYTDAGTSGVYVTVKLVRSLDGVVLSATNFMVDRKLVGKIIGQ